MWSSTKVFVSRASPVISRSGSQENRLSPASPWDPLWKTPRTCAVNFRRVSHWILYTPSPKVVKTFSKSRKSRQTKRITARSCSNSVLREMWAGRLLLHPTLSRPPYRRIELWFKGHLQFSALARSPVTRLLRAKKWACKQALSRKKTCRLNWSILLEMWRKSSPTKMWRTKPPKKSNKSKHHQPGIVIICCCLKTR